MKMPPAYFRALGLEVRLGENQSYRDEGFVSNLEERIGSICKEYGMDPSGDSVIKDKDAMGFCVYIQDGNKQHVHILYRRLVDKTSNLFIRGHEETHAILRLKKAHSLFWELFKQGNIPPLFRFLKKDFESVADIGGLLAVEKAGF